MIVCCAGALLSFGKIKSRGYQAFLEVKLVGFDLNLIALGGNEMKMTCSQRQWLHSSVGRASHRYRKVTGSNPVEVLDFFQASLRNCINCVHCDDHFFIFISFPQFIYDLFHISLTLISFTGTYEPTIDLLPTSVVS